MKISSRRGNVIMKLKLSFHRFPETAFISIMLAVVGIILNREFNFSNYIIDNLEKLIMVLILAVPISTYGKLMYENNNKLKIRIFIDIIAVMLLSVIYFNVPNPIDSKFMIRFFSLIMSFLLIFSLISYYKKDSYSIFIIKIIGNFFITFIYSLIMYIGISSMIFTVEKLFELNINNDIYLDIFILISTIFSITYFLARLPENNEKMKATMYPKVLEKLNFYIIIPLIIIYTLILYSYFIKIIMIKEFPINLLSHLVLWYGFISVLVLFFINQIKDQNKYISIFYKCFPVIFKVPLIMMFLAIFKRIADFSITPPRYYVVVLGIWLLFSMSYIFFSKKFNSKALPLLAIFLILLSVYGPQSSFTVSKNAQENRFLSLSESFNMIENNKIIKNENLSDEEKIEINNFIKYFKEYSELKNIAILSENFKIEDMEKVFGFEYKYYYRNDYIDDNLISYYSRVNDSVIDVSEFDYFLHMDFVLSESKSIENKDIIVQYDDATNNLTIINKNIELGIINIENMIKDYHKKNNSNEINSLEEAYIDFKFEELELRFIIEDINYNENKEYNHIGFKLLINIE